MFYDFQQAVFGSTQTVNLLYFYFHSAGWSQLIIAIVLLSHLSGVCIEADSGGALSGEDWEDPPLTELQGIQLSGDQQVGNWHADKPTVKIMCGGMRAGSSAVFFVSDFMSVCVCTVPC